MLHWLLLVLLLSCSVWFSFHAAYDVLIKNTLSRRLLFTALLWTYYPYLCDYDKVICEWIYNTRCSLSVAVQARVYIGMQDNLLILNWIIFVWYLSYNRSVNRLLVEFHLDMRYLYWHLIRSCRVMISILIVSLSLRVSLDCIVMRF